MQTATVFNIQKFSLNDGPGIRTVVFLKGCPLRCAWCANPESQQQPPQLEWKESACVGCGACLAAAPGAQATEHAGKRHVDVRALRGDAPEAQAAVRACPAHTLTVVGETKTVEEILRVCLQDQPFYEDSGGGVTLSGGEALMWPDFCVELLDALRRQGSKLVVAEENVAALSLYVAGYCPELMVKPLCLPDGAVVQATVDRQRTLGGIDRQAMKAAVLALRAV